MPRPRSLSPKKFWHSHKGEYAVKIGGHFHYLGDDEQKAEQQRCILIAEWLASDPDATKSAPRPPEPPKRLVLDVVNLYETHARTRYGRDQLGRIKAGLIAVVEVAGTYPADEFGPRTLKAVRDLLLTRRSKRGKAPEEKRPRLSRNYVNSVVGCIQTAWAWLAAEEVVPAERALALRTVRALRAGEAGQEVPHIVAVAPEVVTATLPHLCPVVAAMVQVQQLTGCRPSEVCKMRRCDFSCTPDEKIVVPGTKPPMRVAALEVDGGLVWLYVPESHKTLKKGKRRVIAVGPRAQMVLRPFLEGRALDAYLFSPKEASDAWREERGREKKYGRQPGARYSHGSYRKAIQASIRRANRDGAGLPLWAPNALRKATATLSDEKAGRDTTCALLGHSQPDMASVYSDQAVSRAATFAAAHG